MMFAYSLKKSELTAKRLDPSFYSPEQIVNEKKLSALFSEPLESLRIEDAPIVYGILKPEGTSEGLYRVAKAEKFQGMFVDSDDCDEVSKTVYESFKRSVAKTGDVLIAIGGYVGRPAILNVKSGANCNINRHISRVRVDSSKIDPYYLVVFLSSRHGQKRLERQITGSVQAGINLEDLREVHVSLFEKATQKYIGDKVRQAEQLRAWAKLCLDSARNKLSENLTRFAPNTYCELQGKDGSLTVCVKSKEIDDRLDSWFYKAEFTKSKRVLMELEDNGISTKPLKSIGTVEYGFMPLEDYWSPCEGHQFLRVTNIKENLIVDSGDVKFVNPVESNAPKYRLKEGDIVVVQLGNSTGRIAYISSKYENWAYPSFALRVRLSNNSGFDSGYTSLFLSEVLGQNQILRTISITSVRPNTTKPAIESIAIPELSIEEQQIIGTWIREMTAANENATALISSSKTLVEALIEGQITEQQLIQAQQALDDGDNSLDQAILSKLSGEGYGIANATPLFSDIDELYRLLESATQAEAEE
ncbi:restriction endonuclease subunit S [Vibrio parahaemolyticus]|uniref:restriction endonuclease subunit S n=1 Tax=Vibrio parahaemolyticus TaxID=670 RepID=UPI001E60A434|nr:restriction endonuclease subunit S [Vibrio parahaemolyticus]